MNVDATAVDNIIDCKDYSNLKRLLRVTTYVLRFVQALKARLRNSNQVPANELTSEELAAAKALWIRDVQAAVRRNPKYPDWSRQPDLYTDATSMLRCKGRLENAELPSDTKNPILLDTKSQARESRSEFYIMVIILSYLCPRTPAMWSFCGILAILHVFVRPLCKSIYRVYVKKKLLCALWGRSSQRNLRSQHRNGASPRVLFLLRKYRIHFHCRPPTRCYSYVFNK